MSWWMAMALAGEPRPADLTDTRLDDISAWEKGSRVLLEGPDACVAVEGEVTVKVALYTPGGWLSPGERQDLVSTGSFVGTLDEGVWTSMNTTWDPKQGDQVHLGRLHPIVGRLPPDPTAAKGGTVSVSSGKDGTNISIAGGAEQSMGLLDSVLSSMNPSVVTSYTRWDGDLGAVVLEQKVPLNHDRRTVAVAVRFPRGHLPTRLDAVFPRRISLGKGLRRVSVHDAQFHLRGQLTPLGVLPGVEGASVVIGMLGYTVGFEQEIRYLRARACR